MPAAIVFDREFRDALGLFATGVVVITSAGNAGRGNGDHNGYLGATVSSFSSVSLDPPLILFSIGRHSKAFAAWQSVDSFAVNILGENQSAMSTRFARALTDKWDGVSVCPGLAGVPLLSDALAWIECRSYAKYDGGDHLIIVGQVLSLTARPGADTRPLVFIVQSGALMPAPIRSRRGDREQGGDFGFAPELVGAVSRDEVNE
jgi:flavin reductase (DIM6/NTAB) family NADH-FMN oxidoreductase RutF